MKEFNYLSGHQYYTMGTLLLECFTLNTGEEIATLFYIKDGKWVESLNMWAARVPFAEAHRRLIEHAVKRGLPISPLKLIAP